MKKAKTAQVFPVILAGGKGERFWPYSNSKHPKQLLPLVTDESMLEDTLKHLRSFAADAVIHIIASDYLVDPMKKTLKGHKNVRIIGEPMGRNTAPAIALAASLIRAMDPQGVMLVLTADHSIRPPAKFKKVLKKAVQRASLGESLITFGVVPDRPETGYGYVKLGAERDSKGPRVFEVKAFVEKPSAAKAKNYLKSGGYLWNSGMFAWRVDYVWEQLQKFQPEITKLFEAQDLEIRGLTKKLESFYAKLPSVSIDYGLMENAPVIECVEAEFQWDDVGSWSALERIRKSDKQKNVLMGQVISENNSNCTIFGGDGLVVCKGMKDVLVAQIEGVTLVVPKSEIPDLKTLVARVREEGLEQFL